MPDVGYYTLPVILSFQGVDKQVNTTLGQKMGFAGKKAGNEFGQGLAGGIKTSETKVKSALDKHTRLLDKQKDAIGKVRVEQEKLNRVQSGSDQIRITAQVERTEKARRDEARATKLAADALNDYEKAAKDAARAGDDFGKSMDNQFKGAVGQAKASGVDAGHGFVAGLTAGVAGAGSKAGLDFLEGFMDKAGSLGKAGGPIALALAGAATITFAAGKYLADQFVKGMETGQQKANFSASLGLGPHEAKMAGDAAGRAYANNFATSLKDALDIGKIVIQGHLVTGASDPTLQKVIEQVDTVRTVTQGTAEEVVAAAKKMVETGLAGSVTEALDLITAASQRGLNINGDLLETVNEYSIQFKKLGLTGPKALGAISQLMKAGIRDSDVAADLLKEFSIRAVDGSKLTAAAYQALGLNVEETSQIMAAGGPAAEQMSDTIIDRLNAIQDPLLRNQVGVALFGTQFEDTGDAIRRLDLSSASGEFQDFAGTTERAAHEMGDTTASAVEQMKRDIEMSMSDIQEALVKAFGPYVKDFANEIRTHKPEIIGFFTTVADVALSLAQDFLKSFGQMAVGLGDWLNIIGDTIGGILKAGAALQRLTGDTKTADEWDRQAESMFSLGEGARNLGRGMLDASDAIGQGREDLRALGKAAQDAARLSDALGESVLSIADNKDIKISANTPEIEQKLKDLGIKVETLPDGTFKVTADTAAGQKILDNWRSGQTRAPVEIPATIKWVEAPRPRDSQGRPFIGPLPPVPAPRAGGGGIYGAGGPTSDNIPIWASSGEHMFSASDVNAMGGQAGVYAFRHALHRAAGGAIGMQRGGAPKGGVLPPVDLNALNKINEKLKVSTTLTTQMRTDIMTMVRGGGEIKLTTNSPEVIEDLEELGLKVTTLPDGTVTVKADTDKAKRDIQKLSNTDVTVTPEVDTTLPVGGGPVPGGPGLPGSPGQQTGEAQGSPNKLTPTAAAVWNELRNSFPNMTLHGWGPGADHNNRKCIDAMVGDTPEGKRIGDRIAGHYLKDPRTQHIIWQQRMWYPGKGLQPLMGPRGSRTADHYDHPHIETKMRLGGVPGFGGGDKIPALLEGGEHIFTKNEVKAMGGQGAVYAFRKNLMGFQGGGQVPDWDAIAIKESGGRWDLPYGDRDSTGGLQIRQGTWEDFGGLDYAPKPYLATKAEQIAVAEKILDAQGPEAWAGGANFVWKAGPTGPTVTDIANGNGGNGGGGYQRGTGPGGEQGYFTPPNPQDVATQRQALEDAQDALKAEQDLLEGMDENNATRAEIVAQQAKVNSAQATVDTERQKLAEAERGIFTAGEPPEEPFPGYQRVPATAEEVGQAHQEVVDLQGDLDSLIAAREDLVKAREELNKPVAFGEEGPTAEEIAEADRKIKEQDDQIAALKRRLERAKSREGEVKAGTYEEREAREGAEDESKKIEHDPELQRLGELPGILVNGLFESLGIGSIFPDLTQTPAWKSFAGLLTAFKGPIQGAVEGKLGIQQPGWQPGMPIPGSGDTPVDSGQGGIPMPFGIPNVVPPPPPPPGEHPGTGAPPGPPVVIDQSQNFTNSPLGWDPVEVERQRRRTQDQRSLPRLPVG